MIGASRLPSRRVATLGVTVVIMLIGVILAVRVTSRPAYEATAEISVDLLQAGQLNARPQNTALLNQEREVLESAEVAQLAASLMNDLSRGFPYSQWASPIDCEGCVFDAEFVLANRGIAITKDPFSNEMEIRFRADDPNVAREGANAIVEAYRRVRSQDPFSVESPDVPIGITSLSLAPTPSSGFDTLDAGEVWRFVLVSMLAVYLTWRWWPDPRRHQSDRLSGLAAVVALLLGLFIEDPWFLIPLALAMIWAFSDLFARYLDDKLPIRRETG